MTAELRRYEGLHFDRVPRGVRVIPLRMDGKLPATNAIWRAVESADEGNPIKYPETSPFQGGGILLHWFKDMPGAVGSRVKDSTSPSFNHQWELIEASEALNGMEIIARESGSGVSVSVISGDQFEVSYVADALKDKLGAKEVALPKSYGDLMTVLDKNLKADPDLESRVRFTGLEIALPDLTFIIEVEDKLLSLEELKQRLSLLADKDDKAVSALYLNVDGTTVTVFDYGEQVLFEEDTSKMLQVSDALVSLFKQDN